MLGRYASFYSRSPYIASFGTCLVKGAAADAIAQTQIERTERFSFRRNALFALWSASYCGCAQVSAVQPRSLLAAADQPATASAAGIMDGCSSGCPGPRSGIHLSVSSNARSGVGVAIAALHLQRCVQPRVRHSHQRVRRSAEGSSRLIHRHAAARHSNLLCLQAYNRGRCWGRSYGWAERVWCWVR